MVKNLEVSGDLVKNAGDGQEGKQGMSRSIGSKVQRSPGVWRLRVTAGYDPVTNKPIQKSMTFKGSERQAEKELQNFAANAPKGHSESVDAESTLAQVVDRWLDFAKARLGGKTFLSYESFMKRVKADLGHLPITAFEKRKGGQLLDKQYERWLAAGVPAATVKRTHEILRNCLRQAERWDLLDSVASDHATPPKHAKPPIRDVAPEEIVGVIEESRNRGRVAYLPAAITLNAVTGMRAGELCALTWPDFNPKTKVIRVDKAITQESNRQWMVGPTKTTQMRDISLEDDTVRLLLIWREERETACHTAGARLDPRGYIFGPDPTGSQFWKPQSFSQAVRRLGNVCCPQCRYAKKPDPNCSLCDGKRRISTFDVKQLEVRHFTATQLIASGLDVVTVAGVMGHHPTVTLSNYAAWQRKGGQRAAEVITDVVFGLRELIADSASDGQDQAAS